MTQSPTGGPAMSTRKQTNPSHVQGGAAMRVIIVADGRAVDGGPASPVYFVKASELRQNGGQFSVQSNKPVPIVEASAGIIVSGGAAIPVYDVTGMPDDAPVGYQPPVTPPAPGGDPIGDALRADAVAYYTLDEKPNGTRADSTAHGYNLAEDTDPCPSDTGKVGNSFICQDSDESTGWKYFQLVKAGITPAIDVSAGITISAWIKTNQAIYVLDPEIGYTVQGKILCGPAESPPLMIGAKSLSEMRVFCDSFAINGPGGLSEILEQSISIDAWHLVTVWYDPDTDMGYLQVDNGDPLSHAPWRAMSTMLSFIHIGNNNNVNASDIVWFDEIGIWPRPLMSDERDYLYNSGAGRALFPAP